MDLITGSVLVSSTVIYFIVVIKHLIEFIIKVVKVLDLTAVYYFFVPDFAGYSFY